MWDLKDKKVFQSRDVIFLEDQALKHIKKDKGEKKPSYNDSDVSSDYL